MSAMDDWGGEITEQGAPVLVIIEGLTMYLSQADVQRIFAVTAGRFPEAAVFVETMSPMVVRRSGKSPSRAAMQNSPGA